MSDTIEVQLVKGIPNVQLAVMLIVGTGLAWFLICGLFDQFKGNP